MSSGPNLPLRTTSSMSSSGRITSYNVCYTKLLRADLHRGSHRTHARVLRCRGRITSYNVCYTKLLRSFFPKNLPLGALIGGFARMLASTVSGAVFFGSYAADYGFTNVWAYSLVYNFFSIGVDTILCVVVASLPPVQP